MVRLIELGLGSPQSAGGRSGGGGWLLPAHGAADCFSPLPVSAASVQRRSLASPTPGAPLQLVFGQMQLSERYEVLDFLGAGASSHVHRARDKSSDKLFAIKSQGKKWALNGKARQGAERELAVLRK